VLDELVYFNIFVVDVGANSVYHFGRLWGGILVAIPTAIPEAPFTRRFGILDGSTVGSLMESSKLS
jgi:hypothetical protein